VAADGTIGGVRLATAPLTAAPFRGTAEGRWHAAFFRRYRHCRFCRCHLREAAAARVGVAVVEKSPAPPSHCATPAQVA